MYYNILQHTIDGHRVVSNSGTNSKHTTGNTDDDDDNDNSNATNTTNNTTNTSRNNNDITTTTTTNSANTNTSTSTNANANDNSKAAIAALRPEALQATNGRQTNNNNVYFISTLIC